MRIPGWEAAESEEKLQTLCDVDWTSDVARIEVVLSRFKHISGDQIRIGMITYL
jgi:hypothetical protein